MKAASRKATTTSRRSDASSQSNRGRNESTANTAGDILRMTDDEQMTRITDGYLRLVGGWIQGRVAGPCGRAQKLD